MSNYKNGPEEIKRIPRMPDAVLECIIQHSLFKHLANRYEGEDRDRLHGLMHDTAEEVLARVSLSAPVASAAPSGELPPLPQHDCESTMNGKLVSRYYSEAKMQAYASAAIANKPPKEAMTDEQIEALVPWQGDPADPFFDRVKFARAIESASAPNKQLVAALRELYRGYVRLLESGRDKIIELGGDCDPVDRMEASDPELRNARAALAAVGEVQS